MLAGEPPQDARGRLARGAALVLCAAACAYGVLIGAGILLLQPERWPTALASLAAAALLIPLWRRLAP
jgi:hypothetical protein